MNWLKKPLTLIILLFLLVNVLYLCFIYPGYSSGAYEDTALGPRPEMTGLGIFAYIIIGLIIGLVILGSYIWTLVDIIRKKPGIIWIILIIICLILPFILGLLGSINSLMIILLWWLYARKQYQRKVKKDN